MTNFLITVTPDPPVAGQSATICYDFSKLENPPASITLSLTWSPSSVTGPTTVTVTPTQHCVTITVPDDATGLTVDDPTDNSLPWDGPVAPGDAGVGD